MRAVFTNVNAAAPNSGGDVSQKSQVRSTYFRYAQLEDSALRGLNIESWSLVQGGAGSLPL